MKTRYAILTFGLLITGLYLTTRVTGGDLNPGNTPSPTMRTLDELYKNIQPGLPSDWQPYPKAQQVRQEGAIDMEIQGVQQGLIRGSAAGERPHRKDSIVVVGQGHEINLPYDLPTGLPTGRLVHGAFTITKYIDRASPKLYQAMDNTEKLTTVDLQFYRTNDLGEDEHYYSIRLTNARIVSVRTAYPNIEQVSFLYESIRFTWPQEGIEYEMDHSSSPV